MKRVKLFTVLPLVLLAVYIASCANTPPTAQEIADAEAAVAAARAAGCPDCAPEECAAAEAALAKAKALAGEFCAELEAKRLLAEAKAKADEARFKCLASKEAPVESPAPPPAPVETEYGLKDIFFDYDKSNIRGDAEPVLQENAEVLKNNPDLRVVVEGYADIRGTDEYNLALAQRRADSTKAYLVQLGVDPGRIDTVSRGETSKFGEGTTEESYQLNRRARFIPVKPGSAPGARIYIIRDNSNS